jgi:hypothetical protein
LFGSFEASFWGSAAGLVALEPDTNGIGAGVMARFPASKRQETAGKSTDLTLLWLLVGFFPKTFWLAPPESTETQGIPPGALRCRIEPALTEVERSGSVR